MSELYVGEEVYQLVQSCTVYYGKTKPEYRYNFSRIFGSHRFLENLVIFSLMTATTAVEIVLPKIERIDDEMTLPTLPNKKLRACFLDMLKDKTKVYEQSDRV